MEETERILYDAEEMKMLGWVLYGIVALIWSTFATVVRAIMYEHLAGKFIMCGGL